MKKHRGQESRARREQRLERERREKRREREREVKLAYAPVVRVKTVAVPSPSFPGPLGVLVDAAKAILGDGLPTI